MTTNGISIPDDAKVEVPLEEAASEETWEELTNNRGEDDDNEQ